MHINANIGYLEFTPDGGKSIINITVMVCYITLYYYVIKL